MDFSRRKSCTRCKLAKTRCNLDSPTCSRCRKKRLDCKYEYRNAPSTTSLAQTSPFHSWLASTNGRDGSAPVDFPENELLCAFRSSEYLEFPGPVDAALNNTSAPISPEGLPTLGDSNVCLADGSTGPTRSLAGDMMDEESIFWIDYQPSLLENDGTSSPVQRISVPGREEDTLPISSAMKNTSRLVLASWQALRETTDDIPMLLSRKKPMIMSSLMAGNCMWATIESYATQLGNASLPFIHKSFCARDNGGRGLDFNKLSEPLANCFNIIPLYMRKTPTTEDLAFKTLVLEIQRLYDEARDPHLIVVQKLIDFSSKRMKSKLYCPPCRLS